MRRSCSAAISSRDATSIGFRSFLEGAKSAARFDDAMNSHFPLLRVPVFFQIADQRRGEVAVGLLARVDRHVPAELIEGLLRDTKRAPVAGRAHDAGIRKARDHPIERRIHLAGWHDL